MQQSVSKISRYQIKVWTNHPPSAHRSTSAYEITLSSGSIKHRRNDQSSPTINLPKSSFTLTVTNLKFVVTWQTRDVSQCPQFSQWVVALPPSREEPQH